MFEPSWRFCEVPEDVFSPLRRSMPIAVACAYSSITRIWLMMQIPSSAEEVEDKTLDWLFGLPSSSASSTAMVENKKAAVAEKQGENARGSSVSVDSEEPERHDQGYQANTVPGSSYLTSSYEGGLMTSNLNTPEKVGCMGCGTER